MTHVKTPHPHREMMKAYADDVRLCALVKAVSDAEWALVSQPSFFTDCQYFLCLPEHKDTCLRWLNGEDAQYRLGASQEWEDYGPIKKWSSNSIFMGDLHESRIKPKKVKKVIATFKDGGKLKTTKLVYDSIDQLKSNSFAPNGFDNWTFHEIEIEE